MPAVSMTSLSNTIVSCSDGWYPFRAISQHNHFPHYSLKFLFFFSKHCVTVRKDTAIAQLAKRQNESWDEKKQGTESLRLKSSQLMRETVGGYYK